MKKKVKNNIRSILLKILIIIASISTIIFIRDVLVKRGVSIVMFTRKDYMNAAEYYMQQSLKVSIYMKVVCTFTQSQIPTGM